MTAAAWREVTSWNCNGCGAESLIVEREDALLRHAISFDRLCASCGALAPGVTIRPARMAYRITTRQAFYPKKRYAAAARASTPRP